MNHDNIREALITIAEAISRALEGNTGGHIGKQGHGDYGHDDVPVGENADRDASPATLLDDDQIADVLLAH